jgi:hypothetical protein
MFLSLTLLIFVWKFKSLQVEIINISFVKIVEDALFIMIIIIFSFYKPIYGALFFSFFFFFLFFGKNEALFIYFYFFFSYKPTLWWPSSTGGPRGSRKPPSGRAGPNDLL